MFFFFETVFEQLEFFLLRSIFFLVLLLPLWAACFHAEDAKAASATSYTSGRDSDGDSFSSLSLHDKNSIKGSSLPHTPEEIHQLLEETNKHIEGKNEKIKQVIHREYTVLDELDSIEMLLNQTRLKSSAIVRELDDLESKIHRMAGRHELLQSELNENKTYLKARLNMLYRMKMMEKTAIAPMSESLFDRVVRHNAMKTIIKSDFTLLNRQYNHLKEIAALEDKLKKKRDEKKRLNLELSREMTLIEGKREEKNKLLTRSSDASTFNISTSDTSSSDASSSDTSISFADLPGLLDMPVKGRIISTFGEEKNSDYKAFTFQSGIDIRVERGEPVKSVFKGKVVYSHWLKRYGNVMIIDHGNSYYTLYAHLEERFKYKGALVDTSEVIATAGDTDSLKGTCLHFEIRHHGTPVDPLKWLKKGV